jgi:hypothetical protein
LGGRKSLREFRISVCVQEGYGVFVRERKGGEGRFEILGGNMEEKN